MNKGEYVTSYLNWLQDVKGNLVAVGDTLDDDELMWIDLNWFTKEWDVLVQVINGWDTLLSWDQIWIDFNKEELRLRLISGSNKKTQKSGE